MPRPVGRSSRAPSNLGGAHLCGFCPAWISDFNGPPALTNRDNSQRAWFPGMPSAKASFRIPPFPRGPSSLWEFADFQVSLLSLLPGRTQWRRSYEARTPTFVVTISDWIALT